MRVLVLARYGVKGAYPYIGGLIMCYAVAAMIAIWRTPETKGTDLEK